MVTSNSFHYVIFRVADGYRSACSLTPDLHDIHKSKEAAWLAARAELAAAGADVSAVIDLTNTDPVELVEYLR